MRVDNIKKAYIFFSDAEDNGDAFTLTDIRNATGWRISTINGYRTKKWHTFLIPSGNQYRCEGFKAVFSSEDVFIRLHRQKSDFEKELLRPRFTPVIDSLIDKARESALLAIQIYNNPLCKFRSCGFIVHMAIAQLALFHSDFERRGVDYWHKNRDGSPITIDGEKKYWELEECLNKYYEGKNTPESENLRLIIKLRNKIEHRIYPTLDLSLSGYCQALLTNFEERLVSLYGHYFSIGENTISLAMQLTSFNDDKQKPLTKIQSENYIEIKRYIEDFCNLLPSAIVQNEKFCFRAFLIPKLGNHAKSSDVAIEFVKPDISTAEGLAKYNIQIAFIKEIHVQVADQGKYRAKDVIKLINMRSGLTINLYLHAKAWKYYGIRTSDKDPSACNSRYCQYSEPFRDIIYTDAWVEFLCEKLSDPIELEIIKKYKVFSKA